MEPTGHPASPAREKPAAPTGGAGTWHGFATEAGDFVLHVPTSHLFEVPESWRRHIQGETLSPETVADIERGLAALVADLPRPAPRAARVDIQAVSLNLAQGCNLSCTYCFAGEGDYGKKGMMTLETAVSALTQLSAGRDRFHITFFGGEPLLNWPVLQGVVEWTKTRPCRYTFAVTTNGTLLTAEKLAFLARHHVAVTLSYDGPGLQARQRRTKDGGATSEAILDRKLKAFGDQLAALRDFKLRSTVTRDGLDLLETALFSTLSSHNYRTLVSHHATEIRAMAFGPADIDRLGAILTRIIDRFVEAGDWETLLRIDMIRGFVRQIHAGRTGLSACGAGVSYLTLSADGGYYLCHRFNENQEAKYGDVAAGGPDRERLAAYAAFRNRVAAPCDTCWMREWCAGGCFYDNRVATGSAMTPDPMYCRLQDLELTQAVRVYTLIAEHAPHLLES